MSPTIHDVVLRALEDARRIVIEAQTFVTDDAERDTYRTVIEDLGHAILHFRREVMGFDPEGEQP